MFLHLLTPEQRETFFHAGTLLAHVDGMDPREAVLLEQAQLEWGVEVDHGLSELGEDKIIEALGGLDPLYVRNVMLVELAGIAVADEKVSSQELELFGRMCEALGADHETSQAGLELAGRWRELTNESDSFIAGG